jgi:hypothetical protein
MSIYADTNNNVDMKVKLICKTSCVEYELSEIMGVGYAILIRERPAAVSIS